jgi:2-hydroxy-3-keto-5-methylthiopentenyl-1-phosphate phosphatase
MKSGPSQIERRAGTARTVILCDFDGTVSVKDTVNRLIRDHARDAHWRFHIKRYLRGEVGSREVYRDVAPILRITPSDLDRFVDAHAELDPAFPAFLDWAEHAGVDVKIVSDGFDATIHTLLAKHRVPKLEVFANHLILSDDGQVRMDSPHDDPSCGRCGTCKVGVVRKLREQYDKVVLIGDGESDRHAAAEADAVLALRDLFTYCAAVGIPCVRIDGFHEVPRLLSRRVEAVTFDLDGTLVDSTASIAEAFNYMFRHLGYPLMSEDEVVRKTAVSLLSFVTSFLRPEETERGIELFTERYHAIFRDMTSIMPGAREALAALNGNVVQGIVTNKRGRFARALVEHLGLADSMVRILGAEDGFKAKPSGDMFEEFVRFAGVRRENTVYVGDAPLDIEASSNAGIDAFVIPGPIFSAEELALHRPRRVLNSIAELPEALNPIVGCSSCAEFG